HLRSRRRARSRTDCRGRLDRRAQGTGRAHLRGTGEGGCGGVCRASGRRGDAVPGERRRPDARLRSRERRRHARSAADLSRRARRRRAGPAPAQQPAHARRRLRARDRRVMSLVHDQSYRRYTGARRPIGRAWIVILRTTLGALFARRPLIGLLLLSWVPFLVRTVQIYVVESYPQAVEVLAVSPRTFRDFIDFQGLFAFFVTIYAGSGLIAGDRRVNALQIYLSKPLLRTEYIAGKLGALMVCLALVTLVPAVMLLIMQVLMAGNLALHRAAPGLLPAVLLASMLRIVVPAMVMVALSSLST